MGKIMCIPCSIEFPADDIYQKHKKSGHRAFLDQGEPIGDLPSPSRPPGVAPELPTGVPASAMPTKEFMETVQRIEHKHDKPPVTTPKPSQHPSNLPPIQPLKLTYKYVGECEEHRSGVDTLEIDVNKEHFCIAYCITGKHQIETKEVEKL